LTPGVATKVVSASCGLSAFAVAIVAGLAVDNPFEAILTRAIVSLIGGNVVGFIVGAICERTITDAIATYKSTRPIGAASVGGMNGNGGSTARSGDAMSDGVQSSSAARGAPASS